MTMKVSCDLEVDVNGEEIFIVDKKVLINCSGKLSRLLGKLTRKTDNLKVIFHDFPGGPKGFELIARFCYNKGKIDINTSNVFSLYCAANFMEMNKDSTNTPNLVSQIEKYLEGVQFWTWSEFLVGLKQCQELLTFMSSWSKLHEFLNSFVERLVCPYVSSPFSSSCSSSNRSSFLLSSETSTKWSEDLLFLNIDLFKMVITTMMAQKLDHFTICSFIFDYQKSNFIRATRDEKCKIIERVINLLCLLDSNFISTKCLFGLFRVSLSLKISKSCKTKLESMIGSRLDQATLDDLLVPPPNGKKYMYDVNLILRLQRWFLVESGNRFSLYRLKKVAALMDSFIAEVGPDPNMKPSKFVVLVLALPDFARDSYDRIYEALDTYFEIHRGICEEERMRICSLLNYDKLSPETINRIAQNPNFPSGKIVISLLKRLFRYAFHIETSSGIPSIHKNAKKVDFATANEKQIGAYTQAAKICRKVQPKMANTMKLKLHNPRNNISLPKLCHDKNFV